MCTSPTQQSSSCITRVNGAKRTKRYRKTVISDSADTHTSSRKQSSSMSSNELANTAKKLNTIISKFETPFNREHTNSTATKSFSLSESENFFKPKN